MAARQTYEVAGIIPARGDSKGIPLKNIKFLRGKPLIAYAIEVALKSRYIKRVVVSTDDDSIAKVACRWGGEVIKRPKRLSRDTSSVVDAVIHAIKALRKQGYYPDVVALLQPTSPLRTTDDVDKAIGIFFSRRCSCVMSVSESLQSAYWHLKINKGGYLQPLFGRSMFEKRRQDLPSTYLPNGAIYVINTEILMRIKSFYTSKTLPYIMPPERSVDIDTMWDFKLAENLLGGNR